MANYFDYILESSDNDIDDQDVVYNEMDASVAEFETYIQEGLGIAAKVLIGVGIAAALAGLIALIIKLYKKKKGKSAAAAAKQTEEKAKEAVKKHGGNTKVKTKKSFLSRIFPKKNKDEVQLNSYYEDSEDLIFQEAVNSNGMSDLKASLEKDVSFIEELGEILGSLYRNARRSTQTDQEFKNRLNKAMSQSRDLVTKYRAITSKDIKVSDIVDSTPNEMTLDAVIDEAHQVRELCNDITEMGNRLQKVQREIQSAKGDIDQYDNILSRECKKLEEKIGQPAIAKLQKKIITISDAVQVVMNEYLSAIYNIGENTDDIVTSVRANANLYDLERRTKAREDW
jgi:hypothetical protein